MKWHCVSEPGTRAHAENVCVLVHFFLSKENIHSVALLYHSSCCITPLQDILSGRCLQSFLHITEE